MGTSLEVKSRMRKADLKVVMLGDTDVGKTSLVVRYTERRFQDTTTTIGASFLLKQWGNYNISIWDTAGEEKYQGLNVFYCRNTSAAILVFDLTIQQTFETLKHRYLPLLECLDGDILKVVVGSKLDLLEKRQRQINSEQGKMFARSINPLFCQTLNSPAPYFETSSRTGACVDEVFEAIFETFFPQGGKGSRATQPGKHGFQFLAESPPTVCLIQPEQQAKNFITRHCCS